MADGFELVVVYEDEVLLAVDKPAGVIVHSDGTNAALPTLTDFVREYLVAEGRGEVQPQAVQRLDRETTGLVLFSLDRATQPAIDAQVAGHEMRKRYLAVVEGRFPWPERDVDAPIGRDRHNAGCMRACRSGQGKPALTRLRRVEYVGGQTLLVAELVTGRRHQIRVHLASIGFPVVGDELYGGSASEQGLLLHALSEELDHPVTGEHLQLMTAWPERLWPEREVASVLK